MAVVKSVAILSCAAVLLLGACTNTRHVGVGDPGDSEALAAEKARADALADALDDLRAAEAALTAPGTTGQRAASIQAVANARTSLGEVETGLTALPDGPAKTAAAVALDAVGDALTAVNAALGGVAAVTVAGGSGGVTPASAHDDLDRAEAAVRDAQAKLTAALDADPTPQIRTLLLQAQSMLGVARTSLFPVLQADLQAEIDRLTMRFGKDLSVDSREASRIAPSDDAKVTLTPRRAGVRVAARSSFVATSPTWISALTHYDITDYGTASTARLDIEQDPVAYGTGVAAVIPGAAGTPATVEFPGRGQVFRGIGYDNREFYLARQGSYGSTSETDPADRTAAADIPWLGSSRTGLRANLRGHAISSFQYRADGGLTMKFGGLPPDRNSDGNIDGNEGSLVFGDLEALTATAAYTCGTGTQACDEAGTRDLTVSFGDPSRDPSDEPVYHWTVDVPNPKLGITPGTTADLDQWTRADTVGVIGRYQMLLSNHAGVDDKNTAATGDDEERYLRYAAYGLFQFIDYQTTNDRVGRMQTLHYGYDAFGTHNPLPAATADSIAATLKGRTMAWLVGHTGSNVTGLERMRGNVTLHACIGGSGCQASDFTAPTGAAKPTVANRLTGAIHDLEIALPGGAWGDGNTRAHGGGHDAFAGDLLMRAAIDANGAFDGVLRPDTMPSDGQWPDADSRTAGPDAYGYTLRRRNSNRNMAQYWGNGAFEGAFYGPTANLEAAGTWWLPPVRTEVTKENILGIVGSFGATAQAGE